LRLVLSAILALACGARAASPELGQLDASPALFTVMAAINAAGYDAGLDSPSNHPLRTEIRAQLASHNIPSLAAIKEFYARHKRSDPAQELSQYISFGLSCGGPPDFGFKQREIDVPPEVSSMTDLSPLLARFYQEADIESLWKRAQGDIDRYIQRYHNLVADAVLQSNVYLRQQTSGYKGRRFQIFIELLAPPNQVQARTYGNEDFIVVTPSREPYIFEIRHAYLRYLLDPMATHYRETIERKKALADHLARVRALPDAYKGDFLQVTTESLIKAVESRLDHKPQMVQQALLEGYILAPYFAEALPRYEKQEASMLVYYPELVGSIDLMREDARLSAVQFNKEPAERPVVKTAAPEPAPLTGVAKNLDDAENLYLKRAEAPANLAESKKLFLEALQHTAEKPQQAAAYYGLARIALLEKDPETAEKLFTKVLDLGPEPAVKAWALVYLGKLSLAAGETEPAVKFFQSALKVDGASPKAHEEAEKGVQQGSKR
jgi:tetratricopeptide (TPR) repeat protein